MTVYLDTSDLVKLYVEEPGGETVAALVDRADVVATSVVAYAEARAAIDRLRRERQLTAAGAAAAVRQLDADWPHYLVVLVDDELARAAGHLAAAHGLRGIDAIHLASFEFLLSRTDDDVHFSSADARQTRAARRLG